MAHRKKTTEERNQLLEQTTGSRTLQDLVPSPPPGTNKLEQLCWSVLQGVIPDDLESLLDLSDEPTAVMAKGMKVLRIQFLKECRLIILERQQKGLSKDGLDNTYAMLNLCNNYRSKLEILCGSQFLKDMYEKSPTIQRVTNILQSDPQLDKVIKKIASRVCQGCYQQGEWPKCGECKKVYYCSLECQMGDWEVHKKECNNQ